MTIYSYLWNSIPIIPLYFNFSSRTTMQHWTVLQLRGNSLQIVDYFWREPQMWLSTSLLPTNISIFGFYKSSLRTFSQLHVAKVAVQETKSDDVAPEQGARLPGHLLLRPELHRYPNYSSLRFPYTCLRYRRCFRIDSRRNITYYCRICSAPFSIIRWNCNFCKFR